MEQGQCAKYNNCEKILLILSIDGDKYDVDGLAGDVCWLCEECASDAIPACVDLDKILPGMNQPQHR